MEGQASAGSAKVHRFGKAYDVYAARDQIVNDCHKIGEAPAETVELPDG